MDSQEGVRQIVEHGERHSPYQLSYFWNIHYLQVVEEFPEVLWLAPRIYLQSLRVHHHHCTVLFRFPDITFPKTRTTQLQSIKETHFRRNKNTIGHVERLNL